MPVDISLHPQYAVKSAKYNADKSAATTEGNAGAIAQADAEWATARAEMQMDLVNRQEAEMGRQARMAQIKAANPSVPDKVFEGITDLDQAEKIAQSFQELANQRPSGSSGSWSPPAGGGAPPPPGPEDVDPNEVRDPETGILPSIARRMNDLAPTVLKKGNLAREENQQLQELSLEPLAARFRGRPAAK